MNTAPIADEDGEPITTTIVITPSGWVYLEASDGETQALGDIGVDVHIKSLTPEEDKREYENHLRKTKAMKNTRG